MRDRFDALGPRPERAALFQGQMLSEEPDEVLQGILEEAQHVTGMPLALVTLVLDRIQYFRAHVGLPEDLQLARSTDRDVSFCQLVVRDEEALEVDHASADNRVPQDLVRRYGIQAYRGVPLRVAGGVAGALCVIDSQPRQLTDAQREALDVLGGRAAARLEELRRARGADARAYLHTEALRPVVSELRNLVVPLQIGAESAKVALFELGNLVRVVEGLRAQHRDLPGMGGAREALTELEEFVRDTEASSQRMNNTLRALTDGTERQATTLDQACQRAEALAHHHVKLVGGVTWTSRQDVPLTLPSNLGLLVISSVLGALGTQRQPLQAEQLAAPPGVVIHVDLDAQRLQDLLRRVMELAHDEPRIHLQVDDGRVEVRLG